MESRVTLLIDIFPFLLTLTNSLISYWNDKTNALNCFLDDYGRRNGHYVHAELPVLPFPDQLFDIVLSSHFLFIYSSSEEGKSFT